MTTFTHAQTRRVKTNGDTLSRVLNSTNNQHVESSHSVTTATTKAVYVVIDPASLKSLWMDSSKAVTVRMNDPAGTSFTLTPGAPRQWMSGKDSDDALWITERVVALYISNASGSTATVEIRALHDGEDSGMEFPPSAAGTEAALQSYFAADDTDPDDVTNLKVWLETSPVTGYLFTATNLTGQAADGNAVKGWKDHSASNYHLTEATNGPALDYPADETDGFFGRGALVFDGTNDVLAGASAADWNFLHNGGGMTVFCVAVPENSEIAVLADTTANLSGIGMFLYSDDDTGGSAGRASIAFRNGSGLIANVQASAAADVFPGGELHCIHATMKTGEDVKLLVDGCLIGSAALSGAATASNAAAALTLAKNGTDFWANKYGAFIAYDKVLTMAEQKQQILRLATRYGFPAGHIACLGDSITSGEHTTTTMPARLAHRLGALWSTTNYGVSGYKIADSYTNRWQSTAGALVHRHNFVSVLLGVNDVGQGRTANQMTSDLTTLYDSILATAYDRKLIACTIMPWGYSTAWDAPKQAITDTVNAFIKDYMAQFPTRCRCVDLYTQMGSPSDATKMNPLLLADDIHPNQAGSDIYAIGVANAALSLGLV